MNSKRLWQYISQPFNEVVDAASIAISRNAKLACGGIKGIAWLICFPLILVALLFAFLCGVADEIIKDNMK